MYTFAPKQKRKPAAASVLQRKPGERQPMGFVEHRAKTVYQPKENKTGLPGRLREGVEALSGLDMSDVRVHRNSPEPASLNALAYTRGRDIHVAPGQERHLPHEAWHAVQQKQGRVRSNGDVGGMRLNDSKTLESEADVMGRRALRMNGIGQQNGVPGQGFGGMAENSNNTSSPLIQMTKTFEQYRGELKGVDEKKAKVKYLNYLVKETGANRHRGIESFALALRDHVNSNNITENQWNGIGKVLKLLVLFHEFEHAYSLFSMDVLTRQGHRKKIISLAEQCGSHLSIDIIFEEINPIDQKIDNYNNLGHLENTYQDLLDKLKEYPSDVKFFELQEVDADPLTKKQREGLGRAETQSRAGLQISGKKKLYITNVNESDAYFREKERLRGWSRGKSDDKKKRMLGVDQAEWSFEANEKWMNVAIEAGGTFKVVAELPGKMKDRLVKGEFDDGDDLVNFVVKENKGGLKTGYDRVWDAPHRRPRAMLWEMAALLDAGYEVRERNNPKAPIEFVRGTGKARLAERMRGFTLL